MNASNIKFEIENIVKSDKSYATKRKELAIRLGLRPFEINLVLPSIKRYGFDSAELSDRVFDVIGGSKFAFLHEGKIRLYGDYKKLNGVFYSNLNWQWRLRPRYDRFAI